jgi:L,D-transpeptidase YcbB
MTRFLRVLLLPALLGALCGRAAGEKLEKFLPGGKMRDMLKEEIASLKKSGRIDLVRDTIHYRKDLADFYEKRDQKPGWLKYGNPGREARQLLDAIRKCHLEGLDPAEYHAVAMDSLLRRFTRKVFWKTRMEPRAAVELELLLTDAYLELSYDLLSGRIRPKNLADKWHISFEEADLPGYLEKTLAHGGHVGESLKRLAPPQPEYGVMKYWLQEYRKILAEGGWPEIPAGPALGPDSCGPRVEALCRRLKAGGELPGGSCSESFQPELGSALRRFQAHHGLDATGEADAATLRQLNVPVEERIKQIKLNLECWRWLPQDLGGRHVRVNIADFRLTAYDGKREALTTRVVVGRKEDSTPVFSDRIVSISLNPNWNVPASIAQEEILPELQKDPEYLAKHDMELLADWSEDAPLLRADSIDWSSLAPELFQFRVRQKNGNASALGRIKFVLTNPFNIYLHDTPSQAYFERDKRALSHGCVRVENPLMLAGWLLGPGSEWDEARLRQKIAEDKPFFIAVPEKGVPVHILYWTAFVDKQGGLQFRRDIYGWDRTLQHALREKKNTF